MCGITSWNLPMCGADRLFWVRAGQRPSSVAVVSSRGTRQDYANIYPTERVLPEYGAKLWSIKYKKEILKSTSNQNHESLWGLQTELFAKLWKLRHATSKRSTNFAAEFSLGFVSVWQLRRLTYPFSRALPRAQGSGLAHEKIAKNCRVCRDPAGSKWRLQRYLSSEKTKNCSLFSNLTRRPKRTNAICSAYLAYSNQCDRRMISFKGVMDWLQKNSIWSQQFWIVPPRAINLHHVQLWNGQNVKTALVPSFEWLCNLNLNSPTPKKRALQMNISRSPEDNSCVLESQNPLEWKLNWKTLNNYDLLSASSVVRIRWVPFLRSRVFCLHLSVFDLRNLAMHPSDCSSEMNKTVE